MHGRAAEELLVVYKAVKRRHVLRTRKLGHIRSRGKHFPCTFSPGGASVLSRNQFGLRSGVFHFWSLRRSLPTSDPWLWE